jgi:hypothetical protein
MPPGRGRVRLARLAAVETTPAPRPADDEFRVPFWIVLAGVGVGAFWALAGVLVGARLRPRGHDRDRRGR